MKSSRMCIEIETLPHVLGFCRKEEQLRINRHNRVRSSVANYFRECNKFEVHEEIHSTRISNEGSTKRADIVVIDRERNKGYIIDPTILNHNGEGFKYLKEKFRRVESDAKLKARIFIGPEIEKSMCDTTFKTMQSHRGVVTGQVGLQDKTCRVSRGMEINLCSLSKWNRGSLRWEVYALSIKPQQRTL
ncbi:hypothetical protein ANN_03627 [Periplaneta americana]|uniref:Uncharacterized protein n=1 Tax=Periplaneta americana TaxID=6978 RepID=A0ABQ8TZD7_PERAM|nr:hypothetical protein ANN_03627 [Periplaneta americana]